MEKTNKPVKIVVLQRGWVAVGLWSKDESICTLESPSIIRVWGTAGLPGLMHLAVHGPVSERTILDKSTLPLKYHELTEIFSLDCDSSKWVKFI